MATYIGLDLGGTNIKISVFDDFFHKLGEKRTPTEVRSVRSTSSIAFMMLFWHFSMSST
ncbi:MAG: hypothetical protein V8R94_02505 [Lachnospiraceae bacterium]